MKYAEVAGMSDQAVLDATGWDWNSWVTALDNHEAQRMTHQEIVALVAGEFEGGDWWSQMVTVGYERIRGLRVKNQKKDGFEMGVTKTFPVGLSEIYALYVKGNRLPVRTAAVDKSLRLDGPGGEGVVSVMFYAKGEAKTQVNVQHMKLADVDRLEAMKEYWRGVLEDLLR